MQHVNIPKEGWEVIYWFTDCWNGKRQKHMNCVEVCITRGAEKGEKKR